MLYVVLLGLAMGLLCKLWLSLAPFIVANLLMLAAVVVAGWSMSTSFGMIVVEVLLALVALQAGYALGVVAQLVHHRFFARARSKRAASVRRQESDQAP